MEDKVRRSTSEVLQSVVANHHNDTISLGELKAALHERGFGILMAIAALPLCLPVPVPPGYTTFFSIPLFILSTQMIFGMRAPWFPKWLDKKRIKRKTLAAMVEKASPLLLKIEKLLRPRMTFVDPHTWEKLIGSFSFFFSISIAIPLPLTNLPPGYGILIMSLGLLSKDGVTIIIGMITGVIGVLITIGILILSKEAIMAMFSFVSETPPPGI